MKLLVEEFKVDIYATIPAWNVTAKDIAKKNGHYPVCAYLEQAAKAKNPSLQLPSMDYPEKII